MRSLSPLVGDPEPPYYLPFPGCVQYAELKPVPCTSYADAVALREKEATPILVQVSS